MNNYSQCIPTSSSTLVKSFLADAKRYRKYNDLIPNKSGNIIRILTYNVHYWTDLGSKNVTAAEIMKKILMLNPNLIGLQEVLIPKERDVYSDYGWSIRNIFRPLKDYTLETISVCKVCCRQDTTFGNLLGSNLPLSQVQKILFPNKYESRGAIMGIIQPPTGKKFLYIVTHLDVFDESGEIRREELNLLFQFIEKNYPKNIPTILTGDFNCLKYEDYSDRDRPTGDFDTIRKIEEYGFTDVFEGLKYSVWSGRRVDYVFVKNFYREIDGTYVYYDDLSDHFALIVDILI